MEYVPEDTTIDVAKSYNLRQAARFCNVSASAVRNWMLTGRLKYAKVKDKIYIQEDDLVAIKLEREAEAEAKTEAQVASN